MEEMLKALIEAQKKFKPLKRSGRNPYFNSKYATLDDMFDSTRSALLEHGLVVVQKPMVIPASENMVLRTTLYHISGEYIEAEYIIETKFEEETKLDDEGQERKYKPKSATKLQRIGMAIQYAKRYTLAAMLGLAADEDDDGEAERKTNGKPIEKPPADKIADMSRRGHGLAAFFGLSEEDIRKELGVASRKDATEAQWKLFVDKYAEKKKEAIAFYMQARLISMKPAKAEVEKIEAAAIKHPTEFDAAVQKSMYWSSVVGLSATSIISALEKLTTEQRAKWFEFFGVKPVNSVYSLTDVSPVKLEQSFGDALKIAEEKTEGE